jgi:hypothetical protein
LRQAKSYRTRRTDTAIDPTAGQAAVELALCLPLLMMLLLGVVQVGLMVREQLHLELTAREAALGASRSTDPSTAAMAVSELMLKNAEMDLRVQLLPGPLPTTEMVQIQITITSQVAVPLISALIGQRQLTASVTVAREPTGVP